MAPLAGLCAIAGLMASNVLAADEPRPPLQIQFSLDRPIDAAAAPFVMATARGLFGAEALAVTTNIASGSADAVRHRPLVFANVVIGSKAAVVRDRLVKFVL